MGEGRGEGGQAASALAGAGSTSPPIPLTEGDTNWPLLMATLRDIGYDGPIIQECGGDLDAHRKTAETMRKIVEM